jgi:hypothetical protein
VERETLPEDSNRVATADDLEDYGFAPTDDAGEHDSSPPRPWLKNR